MTGEAGQDSPRRERPAGAWLLGVGLVYVALAAVLAVAYLAGVSAALFPAGWILPAVLGVTGGLMTLRRRFDIAATIWAGFCLAVFVLDALVYTNALDRGLDDPAAFDGSILVAALGLVVLILRPGFRS